MVSRLPRHGQLALAMLLCSAFGLPGAYAYDFMQDGVAFNVVSTSQHTVELTKADQPYSGMLTIPYTVSYNDEEYTVTYVDNNVFDDATQLTYLVVEGPGTEPHTNYPTLFFGHSGTTAAPAPLFQNTKLQGVEIYRNISYGEKSPFYNSATLTAASTQLAVSKLNDNLFYDCKQLKHIVIGQYVTTFGSTAFAGCPGITLIQAKPVTAVNIPSNYFLRTVQLNATLQVPEGSTDAYSNCTGWKNFKHITEYPYYISNATTLLRVTPAEGSTFDVELTKAASAPAIVLHHHEGTLAINGNAYNVADIKQMQVKDTTLVTDGIHTTRTTVANGASAVYNVMGQRVNTHALPDGVYIENGKKHIVNSSSYQKK